MKYHEDPSGRTEDEEEEEELQVPSILPSLPAVVTGALSWIVDNIQVQVSYTPVFNDFSRPSVLSPVPEIAQN